MIALTVRGCKDEPIKDTKQQVIDSLKDVIARQDIEIQKLDEIIVSYAEQYDSTLKVNEELQDRGVKTVVKYKTIRLQTDTSRIIEVCDSLANEYSEFIFQTKETIKAADSLMTAQGSQIELQGSQIANFKQLVNKLEEKISEQEQQIKKWKKLADRRGRAIEW